MIKAYAAFAPGGELKPFEYDPGELGPREVEIDVLHCGICHSDLSVLDSQWGKTPYPMVPGHEVVGRISQVGSAVSDLAPGQAVGLGWHCGYCDSCHYCETDDQNLCAGALSTITGHYGGFADKVRAAANSVVKIPDGMDLQKAGPLFCGGITVFNPLLEYNIQARDKVAVIGIGGLGHLAIKFLSALGCEVTAFTSSESKKQAALSMGATATLNSADPESIKSARGRFDFILCTVNVTLDWNLYLSTLRARGRLHFVGVPLEPLGIGVFQLIGQQRSVSGSPVGSPAAIKKMLDFAHQHHIEPDVEIFPFERVNEAIQHLRDGKAHYRIVLSRS